MSGERDWIADCIAAYEERWCRGMRHMAGILCLLVSLFSILPAFLWGEPLSLMVFFPLAAGYPEKVHEYMLSKNLLFMVEISGCLTFLAAGMILIDWQRIMRWWNKRSYKNIADGKALAVIAFISVFAYGCGPTYQERMLKEHLLAATKFKRQADKAYLQNEIEKTFCMLDSARYHGNLALELTPDDSLNLYWLREFIQSIQELKDWAHQRVVIDCHDRAKKKLSEGDFDQALPLMKDLITHGKACPGNYRERIRDLQNFSTIMFNALSPEKKKVCEEPYRNIQLLP